MVLGRGISVLQREENVKHLVSSFTQFILAQCLAEKRFLINKWSEDYWKCTLPGCITDCRCSPSSRRSHPIYMAFKWTSSLWPKIELDHHSASVPNVRLGGTPPTLAALPGGRRGCRVTGPAEGLGKVGNEVWLLTMSRVLPPTVFASWGVWKGLRQSQLVLSEFLK